MAGKTIWKLRRLETETHSALGTWRDFNESEESSQENTEGEGIPNNVENKLDNLGWEPHLWEHEESEGSVIILLVLLNTCKTHKLKGFYKQMWTYCFPSLIQNTNLLLQSHNSLLNVRSS